MEKNYRAELLACLGDPVDGNPTGVMEEAAFAEKGLNWRYLTIRVEKGNLEPAFRGMQAMGFRGCNLTMPHKLDIIPYLDELSEAAKIIGAVNTVILRDGKWIGENTDGKGFVIALKKAGCTPEGKHITILGAGGAARAISVECALNKAASVTIINRDEGRGTELAKLLAPMTESRWLPWESKMPIPAGTDILINATCVGLHPHVTEKPDIDYTTVTETMVVSDVVFNPVDPLFLQEARKRGAQTVSGIGMLVQQGALNFTLWTGEPAPEQVMYDTLKEEFEDA